MNALKIDLSGRVAVVTGGSGNLGRVITRTLARCGADVAIHYHNNKKQAQSLRNELVKMGRRAVIVQADVTDHSSVMAMKRKIVRALGDPNIIVNNAVVQYRWRPIVEQPLEDYESQYRSCVVHNVLMAKAFVPAMIQKKWGRVIAINTECAVRCFPTESAYVAGKRGMDGVLRVLAREVGEHQITVNQIAPGWMITERDRAAGLKSQPQYEEKVPLKRRGEDQDIANAVAFLASDLAGFITGAFIPVSGGTVMPAI